MSRKAKRPQQQPASSASAVARPAGEETGSAAVAAVERIAPYLAVPVLWLALAGPLFSLPLFKRGLWQLAEPIVIAHFIAAALGAMVLAVWLRAGGRPSRPALLLALPAFLLAAWLLLSGPGGFTGAEWRLRLLGVPQSGFGPLWYTGLGLWLLLGDLVLRQPRAWRLVLWGGMAASAGILVVLGLDRLKGTETVFQVLAYYAWPGLALPVMAWAMPALGRLEIAERIIAGLLAVGLLVLSEALTMMGAALVGLAIALLWWRLPKHGWLGLIRRPAMVGLILAFAALLPLILVSIPALTASIASLEDRRMVWLVIRAAAEQQPVAWLFGNGAGSVSNTMMSHVTFSGFPIWRVNDWHLLTSKYLHAHNWLMQALHDGGLPAVLLTAWLLLQPAWLAQDQHLAQRRGLALGLVVAYILSLGLWFELIFAVPYMALAWIAVIGRQGIPLVAGGNAAPVRAAPMRAVLIRRTAAASSLILISVTYIWGAILLDRYAREIDQQRAWFSAETEPQRQPLAPPPPLPADPRRADIQIADMVDYEIRFLVGRHEPGKPTPNFEREAARIDWLRQIIVLRLPETTSPLIPLYGSTLFDEIMLRPTLAAYRPLLLPHVALWRQIIERGLELAPWRSNIALGYLNWTFQTGQLDKVRELALRLRKARPEDPIGLFFEGGMLMQQPEPEAKRQGAALARRAIAAGVEQFFPLDDNFKALINSVR